MNRSVQMCTESEDGNWLQIDFNSLVGWVAEAWTSTKQHRPKLNLPRP